MTIRALLRVAAVSGGTAAGLLVGSPAFAEHPDAGDDPGKGLSALETLLLFGVVPVGAFLLIALLVATPSIARGPRYRPDRGWQGGPLVFGAPPRAELPSSATIGPSRVIEAPVEDRARSAAEPEAEQRPEGGGASARW